MLTNADATLFIKTVRSGVETWERRVVRNVSWFSTMDAQLVNGGMAKVRSLALRIPEDADFGGAQYVPPHEWTGAEGTWTLRGGDLVARGIVNMPTGGMRALAAECAEMMSVTGISDNRRGGLPHWKVVGK